MLWYGESMINYDSISDYYYYYYYYYYHYYYSEREPKFGMPNALSPVLQTPMSALKRLSAKS